MIFSKMLMVVTAVFFVLGVIDRFRNNRWGLGKELERGFSLMGTIVLSIAGIITLSPLVAKVLAPLVVPLYEAIGADPAMFSPTFLSTDMGGYSIAAELATDPSVGKFGGLVVASMVGAVISFTIPVAVGLIEKEDMKYFSIGIMSGMVASPLGCFFGGLAAGLAPDTILINLVPVLAVSLLLAAGLILIPFKMVSGFKVFARGITLILSIGLVLGAVEKLTGFVLIQGLKPVTEGLGIAGSVVLVIAGILPFLKTMLAVLKKPLAKLSSLTGINDTAMVGMFLALTTIVPVYASFKDMNTKGKVVVAAFTGSAANVLGAHLGFVTAISQDMVMPMVVSKIAAGIIALPFAAFLAQAIFIRKETTSC